jgi:hypothetical protein
MKQYLTTVFFCKESSWFLPEITDEEIADELFKAKSYQATLLQQKAMRQLYMTQQAEDNYYKKTIKYSASSLKHKDMRLLRL